MRRILLGIALAAGLGAAGGASAQVLFTQPDGRTRAYDPLDYYFEGPPDVPGCMKSCAADYSPCDSFFTKQTDGRCKRSRR